MFKVAQPVRARAEFKAALQVLGTASQKEGERLLKHWIIVPEASREPRPLSPMLLSHSVHNDLAFPARGPREASSWKEFERTRGRWHDDNRDDGWQPDTGDGDKPHRQSRDWVPDSLKIDKSCILRNIPIFLDPLFWRPNTIGDLKSSFFFKGMSYQSYGKLIFSITGKGNSTIGACQVCQTEASTSDFIQVRSAVQSSVTCLSWHLGTDGFLYLSFPKFSFCNSMCLFHTYPWYKDCVSPLPLSC